MKEREEEERRREWTEKWERRAYSKRRTEGREKKQEILGEGGKEGERGGGNIEKI
jgi:hypothetical protein